jgi:hypothetical protein
LLDRVVHLEIRFAITECPPIYKSLIAKFWGNLRLDTDSQTPILRSRVQNTGVSITQEVIRQILQLGDNARDPTIYTATFRAQFFDRTGYSGPIDDNQRINCYLLDQWRYLAHVVTTCLSQRKGGSDALCIPQQSMMTGLALNIAYNISKYIFDAFWEKLGMHERFNFYMYPRFIQIILNHKYPNLPKSGELLKLIHMGKRVFVDMKTAKEKVAEENYQVDPNLYTPVHADLIGHLTNPNYMADEHGNDPPGYVAPVDESDEKEVQEEAQPQQQLQ